MNARLNQFLWVPLLALSLCVTSSRGQGSTFLSYRAGASTTELDTAPVNLNEFQLRLPGVHLSLNDWFTLSTAFGYHHADMGPVHRFWGDAPKDAFLFEGSLDYPVNDRYMLSMGTSVRWMRSFARTEADKEAFHRSALVMKRYRKSGDYFRIGVAYRSGVALEVIPILGYEGSLSAKYDISALLPGRAYVFRKLANGNRIGLFGRYQTTPYLLESGSLGDAEVFRHRMIRFGVSNESRVSDDLVLRVDVSSTLVDDHQWVGPSTDITIQLDRSVILDVALIFRRKST